MLLQFNNLQFFTDEGQINDVRSIRYKRSVIENFNGLVLRHLNYADVAWEDQIGLTTQMKLQSFQNRIPKNIVKAKVTSAEALKLLRRDLLIAREAFRSSMFSSARYTEGKHPRTFRCVPF